MKPVILTVHGFNSAGWYMHHFTPFARSRGLCIHHYGYGWLLLKSPRMAGIQQRVVDLVNLLQDFSEANGLDPVPVIGAGHSTGAEVWWRASWKCPMVKGLILINSALDRDVRFPDHLKFVHNWYSPSDIWPKVSRWIPFNKWGDLGSREYEGVSTNVRSFNKQRGFALSSRSHSDVFTSPDKRNYFLPLMLDKALQALEASHDAG